MAPIILSTLNARYIHASLGLRYLFANMQALQTSTVLLEFTIDKRPIEIAEQLLYGATNRHENNKDNLEPDIHDYSNSNRSSTSNGHNQSPIIIGFGVYIWNIAQTTEVITLIKSINPNTIIVVGGPEVSHEPNGQTIVAQADYVICGAADISFRLLCEKLIKGERPNEKIITSQAVALNSITMPYRYYDDEDIRHRILYVEASRGCPFKCEFCLSALDKTAWPFDLEQFLEEMDLLYQRGARQFKFVDRTFNLKIDTSVKILEFFLQRLDNNLFLHFELIPDHLPEPLKQMIRQFPQGSLQFEIGIQSFNPEVQQRINRKQNPQKTLKNLHWLRTETNAHLHTDLIIGLPGEDIASFAEGFNTLVALNPHEIQVGILKRLNGAPIKRHSEPYHIRYNPFPPYNILQSDCLDFKTTQQLSRFARYWDLIANAGRFKASLPLLLGSDAFENFFQLSKWLFRHTGQTHRIALPRLFELLYQGLTQCLNISPQAASHHLWLDYQKTKLKGRPSFPVQNPVLQQQQPTSPSPKGSKRQSRHLV